MKPCKWSTQALNTSEKSLVPALLGAQNATHWCCSGDFQQKAADRRWHELRRFFLNFRLRLRICLKVHEGSICAKDAKGLERCSNSFAKMTYQVTSANTISKYPLPNLQVAWFSMIYRWWFTMIGGFPSCTRIAGWFIGTSCFSMDDWGVPPLRKPSGKLTWL